MSFSEGPWEEELTLGYLVDLNTLLREGQREVWLREEEPCDHGVIEVRGALTG